MSANRDSEVPSTEIPMNSVRLFTPPNDIMANALRTILRQNFRIVSVERVICPDLRMYGFAAPGLSGNNAIVELGNRCHLFPTPQLNKKYSFKKILFQLDRAHHYNYIIGAGKHSCPPKYDIAELYANVFFAPLINLLNEVPNVWNESRVIWWNKEKNVMENLKGCDTCSMHGNFFLSEGNSGPVFRVQASGRIGPHDFITSVQKALTFTQRYPHELMGLGGVIMMNGNGLMYHVTPSSNTSYLNTIEQVQQWLKYNKSTDCKFTTAVGTIVNASGCTNCCYYTHHNLHIQDITDQHFHSFSDNGTGGHIYNNDTNHDFADLYYLGYFSFAENLYLMDSKKVNGLVAECPTTPIFTYPAQGSC